MTDKPTAHQIARACLRVVQAAEELIQELNTRGKRHRLRVRSERLRIVDTIPILRLGIIYLETETARASWLEITVAYTHGTCLPTEYRIDAYDDMGTHRVHWGQRRTFSVESTCAAISDMRSPLAFLD